MAKEFDDVQLDVEFEPAANHNDNLVSKENISLSFGKIAKWKTDFHSSVWSGYGLSINGHTISIVEGGTSSSVDIPNDFADEKVKQDYSTTDSNYPLLISSVAGVSSTASRGSKTSIVNNSIYVNPSIGRLYASEFYGGLFDYWTKWGGPYNRTGTQSFGDGVLNEYLSANRFAGAYAAGITIEYSRDGGATWVDYGATDISKRNLFTNRNSSFRIGGPNSVGPYVNNSRLRITLNTGLASIYTQIFKMHLYVSTNYSTNCKVDITAALESDPDNFSRVIVSNMALSGWPGWNVVNLNGTTGVITTYGNSKASQYGRIRFEFSDNGLSDETKTTQGFIVGAIFGFGGVGWTVPSQLALTGHIYSYDGNLNVTFPKNISTANGGTITATSFSGDGSNITNVTASKLSSNAGSLTQPVYFANGIPVATTYTLEKSVPADAVFTDHITSATTTGSGNAVTSVTADANGALTVTKGSSFVLRSGDTMTGSLTLGTPNQSAIPTAGITVQDIRNATNGPDSGVQKGVNFYFTYAGTPSTGWWSIMHVRGWSSSYSAWELAGPSHDSDQRTTPLYVRSTNKNTAWGSWRKIYDKSNPPTASEVGAAAVDHTHTEYLPITTTYAKSTTVNGAAYSVDVTVTNPDSQTDYGMIFVASPNATGSNVLRKNNNFRFRNLLGTASAEGKANIILGNNIAKGTADNETGIITLYSDTTHWVNLNPISGMSADRVVNIPDKNGTIALTSDIVTYSAGTGISIGTGNVINHSNSITAITTAAFKKFKYDAQGHITGTADVAKSDITALGIPGSDTNTTYTLSGAYGTSSDTWVTTLTPSTGTATTSTVPKGTTSVYGLMKLIDSTSSTSTALAATANSVKSAYDLANGKSTVSISRNLTSGTKIGTITIDGTTTDLYCQTNTNTDTLVKQTADSSTTTKVPILMKTVTTSGTAGESKYNENVTITPSTGKVDAKKYGVDSHATMEYDTTANCIKFIFD